LELVPVKELCTALTSIGYSIEGEQMEQFLERVGEVDGKREVDLWEMERLATVYRHEVRDRARSCQGFQEADVQRFFKIFEKHDEQHMGKLSKAPLRHLIEELLPEVGTSVKEHDFAADMLQKVDEDHNCDIDFDEFLSMMRLIENHKASEEVEKDRANLAKFKSALLASKFRHTEINEFQEVFRLHDTNLSGDIDVEEFEFMIADVLHVPPAELHAEIKALVLSVDDDKNHVLDFPEFLMVMRKVLDEDWHGVKTATENVANTGHGVKAATENAANIDVAA
jgi:Ca2+-binding EF-hand superfamily protein